MATNLEEEEIPLITNFPDLLKHPMQTPGDFTLLPICHTTNTEALRKIFGKPTESFLEPNEYDEFFKEQLLFFFYGRAKYIPSEDVENIYKDSNPPVAFVFDLDTIPCCAKRLLPFDSGGYERYLIDRPLEEFVISLESHSEEIKKIVHILFSENEKYLKKELTIDYRHFPMCTPIGWLSSLYSKKQDPFAKKKFGEQAYTMEIQFNKKVPLHPVAIIIPLSWYSTEIGKKQIRKAFNISESEAEQVIFLYNDDDTINNKYQYITEEVDKTVQKYLKNK